MASPPPPRNAGRRIATSTNSTTNTANGPTEAHRSMRRQRRSRSARDERSRPTARALPMECLALQGVIGIVTPSVRAGRGSWGVDGEVEPGGDFAVAHHEDGRRPSRGLPRACRPAGSPRCPRPGRPDLVVDGLAAPGSRPRSGWSRINSCSVSDRSHLAMTTFCWLPPENRPRCSVGSLGRTSTVRTRPLRPCACAGLTKSDSCRCGRWPCCPAVRPPTMPSILRSAGT